MFCLGKNEWTRFARNAKIQVYSLLRTDVCGTYVPDPRRRHSTACAVCLCFVSLRGKNLTRFLNLFILHFRLQYMHACIRFILPGWKVSANFQVDKLFLDSILKLVHYICHFPATKQVAHRIFILATLFIIVCHAEQSHAAWHTHADPTSWRSIRQS